MNPPNMTTMHDYYHWTAAECSGYRRSGEQCGWGFHTPSPQAVNLVRDSRGDVEGALSSKIKEPISFLLCIFFCRFPVTHVPAVSKQQGAEKQEQLLTLEVSYQSGAKARGERPAPVRHLLWAHFIFSTCAIWKGWAMAAPVYACKHLSPSCRVVKPQLREQLIGTKWYFSNNVNLTQLSRVHAHTHAHKWGGIWLEDGGKRVEKRGRDLCKDTRAAETAVGLLNRV